MEQPTLKDVLFKTGCRHQKIGKNGAIQVFPNSHKWVYFHLADYTVSSAVSGPSYILVPKH